MWLAALLSIIVLFFSVNMKTAVTPCENLLYISSLFSMPQGAVKKAKNLFAEFKREFYINYSGGDFIFLQKDGSINEMNITRDFSDLTVTPEDIVEVLTNEIEKNIYDFDGKVVEETYSDYQATDSFDKTFVRNVTVNSHVDVEDILKNGCKLPIIDYAQPTVLIYHTHSTERYLPCDNGKFSSVYDGRSDDKTQNMVRVGEEIAAVLAAKGIGVVHDRNIYDEVYTGAYEKSRAGVQAALQKYPSIVITLDIHRDAIYYDNLTRVKPVAEIENKKAAQLMIITGAEGGNVENFKNWETNLSFALNFQNAVNTKYENLMKPTYFCNRKYNMDLTPYSLLIEVGTDVNTLEEAAYSARLLGDCLAEFIKNNMEDKNE